MSDKDFKPNLTPSEMFKLGSFGGTYWRPIYSTIVNKNLNNKHLKFPKSWWQGINPETHLTNPNYNKAVNKYKVKVGTDLKYWEDKGWITKYDPYGWVEWYCNYHQGRRSPDDERQIKRWLGLAGQQGRFRKWLVTQILKSGKKWDQRSRRNFINHNTSCDLYF